MKKNINIRIKELWQNDIISEYIYETMPYYVRQVIPFRKISYPKEVMEFVTDGVLQKHINGISIFYNETDLTGHKDMSMQLFIAQDNSVAMQRIGGIPMNLVFEKGKEYICPNESGTLVVTTRRLKNSICEDGGSLDIAYTVDYGGVLTGRSEFNITII